MLDSESQRLGLLELKGSERRGWVPEPLCGTSEVPESMRFREVALGPKTSASECQCDLAIGRFWVNRWLQ